MKTKEIINFELISVQKKYNELLDRIDKNEDAEDRGYRVDRDLKNRLNIDLRILKARIDELKWVLDKKIK